jgi:methyltransferase (TIGR00027 family)
VLGAGLDTFAYRNPFSDRLRVFEVDHPATQDWKRQRLQDAGIYVSSSLTFIPVDFEQQILATEMAANSSFDSSVQTFFAWLGVVPYLTEDAIWSTLDFVASLPGSAHVVFDYSDPPDTLPPDAQAMHEERSARVSALGESWITHFTADELRTKLTALGFWEVEDLGPSEIRARYLPHRPSITRDKGGHYLRATTIRSRD